MVKLNFYVKGRVLEGVQFPTEDNGDNTNSKT